MDTSLNKACVTVKETSVSADKVLKDVVSATQTMSTSTTTCLNTFDAFVSKEGKVTQDALSAHFTVLDPYLTTQSKDITAISDDSHKVRVIPSCFIYCSSLFNCDGFPFSFSLTALFNFVN